MIEVEKEVDDNFMNAWPPRYGYERKWQNFPL